MPVSLHHGTDAATTRTDRDSQVGLSLPGWVSAYVDPSLPGEVVQGDAFSVRVARTERYALASACVAGAATLPPLELQRRTIDAYRGIANALRESATPHPIRFWNFVPAIREPAGDGLDRYMVFNAGRFAAYLDWYGDPNGFDARVPTATGIGHDAPDLAIHVLAAARPGVHIMNPRQRQPRCYSPCYGPFPPCFARATLIPDRGAGGMRVLVGGTAAVCGEQSVHPNDLHRQADETFENLANVVQAAWTGTRGPRGHAASDATDALACFRSLRVYFVCEADKPRLVQIVRGRFPHLHDIEFLRADICRPELLVEIEGTAVVEGELR
jgi:hypothetical protein